MRTRSDRDRNLLDRLVADACGIGYRRSEDQAALALVRPRASSFTGVEWEHPRLQTAAICFSLFGRPRRRLIIDWVCSELPPAELLVRGFSGNAISFTQFHLQADVMKRPWSELLPVEIDPSEEKWPETAAQIEAEIQAIHPAAWDSLATIYFNS